LHVVVTAGPTREYVDPVRFLTNESSGRMGFAIAEAAARAGNRVTLIAGPVHLPTPEGVERVDVVSARQMLAAVRSAFHEADAPCGPPSRTGPRAGSPGSGARRTGRRAHRSPDQESRRPRHRGTQKGDAWSSPSLETGNGVRALEESPAEDADFIVLNGPSSLNAARTDVTILDGDGELERHRDASKATIARAIVDLLRRAPR
jgi:phosphopantothenoylcysteine synthetase/decarboxylase